MMYIIGWGAGKPPTSHLYVDEPLCFTVSMQILVPFETPHILAVPPAG